MSVRDPSIAEALFKHLLAHYWHARDAGTDPSARLFPNGYLISYKALIERSGVPLDPLNAGGPLFDVASVCKDRGWPPLHSLVVRKDYGYPGLDSSKLQAAK